jgi:hypothetical protein
MKTTNGFDSILKELGNLYEFNRRIKRFTFTNSKESANSRIHSKSQSHEKPEKSRGQ